ncbi:hypothetical protein GCM10022224_040030 [Nonomuraea antimicrobica]|uniref:HTH tetR-type domain-containing protein n=1 Tax=Nonomuraea antimicrobica TaxID=561173 RepID=A0ABP7BYZ9_9ACTN
MSADDWAKAALTALAEGGLAAVAVEPLAARLGASKGSFYWHFPNRQALVQAALEHWERDTDKITARLGRIPDPRERLRTLLEWAFADPAAAAISFRLISEADDPQIAEVAKRVNERRMSFMCATLVETGRPEPEARRRVLAGYASYLGIAALRRLAIVHEDPMTLIDIALAELLGPPVNG